MPCLKIRETREDTFLTIGRLYEKILIKLEFSKVEIMDEFELSEYAFKVAVKTLREMIISRYPYGTIFFNTNDSKYYVVF